MTIVQKDVNLTVGSTNYTNVIQVKQELQLQTGPTIWTPLIYYQNYFARDKGLVKQERVDVYTGTPVVIWTDNVKRLVIY
jgi:hypothetical protein